MNASLEVDVRGRRSQGSCGDGGRAVLYWIAAGICILLSAASWAASTSYEYDALGRLHKVTRDDGTETLYELDAAGNRTQVSDLATPGAPPSVNVPVNSSTGSYRITWTAPSETFTAYELYESTSSTFSTQTRVYSGAARAKEISGKVDGSYYYRVRVCNEGLCSEYAAGANPVVVAFPPGTPVSIAVPTISSSGDYPIGWGAPSSGTVTAYELYESSSSSFTSQTRVYNGSDQGWGATSKSTGNYYYRVRACNGASCSDYTTGENGVSVDRSAPSSPGALSLSVDGTSVMASWGAATDNIAVVGYQYRLNSAAVWTNKGSGTKQGLSGLVDHTTYIFEVRALDAAGNAGPSVSKSFTTGSAAPAPPSDLDARLMADCAWNVTWSASAGATYYAFDETNAAQRNLTTPSTIVNCPVGNPDGNKPEWVQACNSIACSTRSYFFSSDTTPPSRPGIPTFSAVTQSSATVTWTASRDASGVAGYRYRLNSGSWVSIGIGTTVGLTGLSASKTYTFEVQARDGAGNYSTSNSASFNTPAAPDTTSPSAPGTPSFSNVTSYSASANWVAASDNIGVTGYEYRLNNAPTWTALEKVLAVNLVGLNQLSTYSFQVRARDGAGNVGPAASGSFTTSSAAPPAPSGLSYSQVANCSWRASWNAVNGATTYELRDTSGTVKTLTVTTGYISCPYNNPAGNKPKWVRACNSVGCGTRAYF
ncbi:fibronectin type III domain-containing protein [Microbulbifer celer]|uniref:Fibronectin type III domain-containing protein n=1 Tax=Microbulbifer celer TaxID=435905 RepID=A0ABW3UCJ6_9GAMM|nr:fibronectin type III domain-containing protein [Microbulbifer celer]UFN55954.1 fibronectin type III domain-containing protein [Microbulbifer celer]